jgi:hypothetical protein
MSHCLKLADALKDAVGSNFWNIAAEEVKTLRTEMDAMPSIVANTQWDYPEDGRRREPFSLVVSLQNHLEMGEIVKAYQIAMHLGTIVDRHIEDQRENEEHGRRCYCDQCRADRAAVRAEQRLDAAQEVGAI